MIQSIFDVRCCYDKWDDSLDGKLCFFADDLGRLKSIVDAGEVTVERKYARHRLASTSPMLPFRACMEPDSDVGYIPYMFCYYDPLYDVKLGHRSGSTVLRRMRGVPEMDWVPDPSPSWDSFSYDYRLATSEDCLVGVNLSPSTKDTPSPYSELFDEFFIFRDWDDLLEGKSVFVGDSIVSLTNNFVEGKFTLVRSSGDFDNPFYAESIGFGCNFRYVYYDPLLEFKRARADGKVVEFLDDGEWHEVPADDELIFEPYLYRIRPEFIVVSNRELAHWLAKGYGEYCLGNDVVSSLYIYTKDKADDPVPPQLRVRLWCCIEWSLPTRRYLGLMEGV